METIQNKDLLQTILDSSAQYNAPIFKINDDRINKGARQWEQDDEYDKRNTLYTSLLGEYIGIYSKRAQAKDKYKLAFFIITMIAFVGIIVASLIFIGYTSIYGEGQIVDIGTVIASVAGIISALIIIPKIIAEHLFPVNEESTMIDMVKSMQDNDAKIRDILSGNCHTEQEA